MVITLLRSTFKLHDYPEWSDALKTHNLAPKAACIVTSNVSSSPTFLFDSNLNSGRRFTTWIINIGATNHMTFDYNIFSTSSPKSRNPYITNANGVPSNVDGERSIPLSPSLSLPHSLLVPYINYNLLLVGKLLESHHCYAIFNPSYCKFQDLMTHKTTGHGKRREGLFSLTVSSPPSLAHAHSAVPNSHVHDQHQI